jgi:hypothetical protein
MKRREDDWVGWSYGGLNLEGSGCEKDVGVETCKQLQPRFYSEVDPNILLSTYLYDPSIVSKNHSTLLPLRLCIKNSMLIHHFL